MKRYIWSEESRHQRLLKAEVLRRHSRGGGGLLRQDLLGTLFPRLLVLRSCLTLDRRQSQLAKVASSDRALNPLRSLQLRGLNLS